MQKPFPTTSFYFIEMRELQINYLTKITFFPHGGISKKIFVGYAVIINETLSQKIHPCSILR